MRLFLKLFSANTNVAFTQIVYNVSGFFLAPFRSIFGSASPLPETGSVFEFDIIVAVIVYWILAIAIIRLFGMGRKVTVAEAHDDLENNAQS